MTLLNHKLHENNQLIYYSNIDKVKIFIDQINKRLKILDYDNISTREILNILDFAKEIELGKVITNCRIKNLDTFRNLHFKVEGLINGFFDGEDAYCVSYFIDKEREISDFIQKENEILENTTLYSTNSRPTDTIKYTIRRAESNDIPEMARLFSSVFSTYPTPIFNEVYLSKIINRQTIFKVAVENGKIISIASAELDLLNMNAEITDCATQPDYRGKGLLTSIIESLEQELTNKGFKSFYSLARAINPGINKSLSKLNYRYRGRLINNCHICGRYEDMNIWVKNI
ncbi:GCN5-related N-acetyltransferase [Ruminiclostridium papyrosolvens DSM 2782]|uniref:GCN5-related N-acetyltransferase n=1 Tax=Ruminiclostridium papyrosolvens DSM 2782 TaxID=588581 RepID=F1TDB0_9FIRM|nr:putative beta-lysine N-acetyltransferase [Ruminiclostridium papyrosolvens]EGD47548.1 GCN5-related N-acetyltransferase [Ruminiclostridium papyrosolvens DSM 2782]WES36506.1 putative beta-lysine N-acetyltransferase [Ruminiclostridium papyrosolvens DSM 2782]